MSERAYDIVVVGGGIGGYTAAIRASQLGFHVALVEKEKLGGTCLHRGCIPSKALLRSAEVYATMKDSQSYGITAESISLDFTLVSKRKETIVDQLYQGVQFLMKKHNIDVYHGHGRIIGPSIFSPKSGTISVEKSDGEIDLLANKYVVIATGSKPRMLPGISYEPGYIMNSDDILQMSELPQSLVIIGGGVIGVEWASMMSDFGVEITIIESESKLLPFEDHEISQELERIFKKRNIRILTQAQLLTTTVDAQNQKVKLHIEHAGEKKELESEKVLISVGRIANMDAIGLENTDIQTEKGTIKVNDNMQTTEAHIYAIGDVNGGVQLAHAAAYEAVLAIEHIAKQEKISYHAYDIPRCVYSRPEIASIGRTEQQLQQLGKKVRTSKISFRAIGKAWVYGETEGFVKVITDEETQDILGVHMIGPHVTEYISEISLAQLLNATPWEMSQAIHPHPTLAEILQEVMQEISYKSS